MSASRPNPGERRVADQHLGERLSALVDGELGHEARERVLAHLATCPKCKAEADAQRRLKNVFAAAAPPSPSESFLARLQGLPGLPGGDDADSGGPPLGGGGFGGGRLPGSAGRPGFPRGTGVFGTKDEPFGYATAGPHAGALPPSEERGLFGGRGPSGGSGLFGDRGARRTRSSDGGGGLVGGAGAVDGPESGEGTGLARGGESAAVRERTGDRLGLGLTGERGFRIHRVGRPAAERPASRGLRFAFVAAGAVSLAAIALGGVTTTGGPADTSEARDGSGSGNNVTPMRTAGAGAVTGPESQRRRGTPGPLLGQGQQVLGGAPVASTGVSAPLLPGIPAPAVRDPKAVRPSSASGTAGSAVSSSLIRPHAAPLSPPLVEPAWQAVSGLRPPGAPAAAGPWASEVSMPAPMAAEPMAPGLSATPLTTSSTFISPTLP
ncbi:hypothetical protein GCM10010145_07470 [Streptomyces ruber]|uniref:Putative zinc-finger domain-containing protein n=2 Tax=Streptomyces TaxID=1883 RepID=A0A918B9R0_9ACTN|nr:zf-HC2 domain-containing protein [Streptomyces ruber]GGQ41595.1 hypothetical protein GCM10010145_07470 [Streptomyces ruber]